MVALLIFAASVLTAGVIGLVVRRRFWPVLTIRRQLIVGTGIAFVLMVGSGVGFLYAGAKFPAADDPRFRGTNSIYIARAALIPGEAEPQRSEILLKFPFEVQKSRDFELRLLLNSAPSPIPVGEYTSIFQGPKVLEARPQRNCQTESEKACIRLERPDHDATLVWDVTPTAEADPFVRVSFPVFWPTSPTWTARLKFDGWDVMIPNPDPGAPCIPRTLEEDDLRHEPGPSCKPPLVPLVLDAHHPRFMLTSSIVPGDIGKVFGAIIGPGPRIPYADRGAEVDIESRQIRFPIKITTSLGLDAQTYAWLAAIGTILSGVLGAGWAWKLIELFKTNPVPAAASAQPPPNPPKPAPASRPSDISKRDRKGRRR